MKTRQSKRLPSVSIPLYKTLASGFDLDARVHKVDKSLDGLTRQKRYYLKKKEQVAARAVFTIVVKTNRRLSANFASEYSLVFKSMNEKTGLFLKSFSSGNRPLRSAVVMKLMPQIYLHLVPRNLVLFAATSLHWPRHSKKLWITSSSYHPFLLRAHTSTTEDFWWRWMNIWQARFAHVVKREL